MNPSILIIDDDPQFTKLMRLRLKKAGFENINCARDEEEALHCAKAHSPDLIILDTVLPRTDGFEICKKMRRLPELSHSKIIITTGSIDAVDAGKARNAGADDYIVKTSDLAYLMNAVKKTVNAN